MSNHTLCNKIRCIFTCNNLKTMKDKILQNELKILNCSSSGTHKIYSHSVVVHSHGTSVIYEAH